VDEDKILHAVEIARNTGKVKIGTNEATKAIERGVAKLVVVAQDTEPKEIIMHLSPLCNEKKIPYVEVKSKKDLGRAAGINVTTAAIAVTEEGDAKKDIEEITSGWFYGIPTRRCTSRSGAVIRKNRNKGNK
jgi:large subunit ribosomal protein L7Ae